MNTDELKHLQPSCRSAAAYTHRKHRECHHVTDQLAAAAVELEAELVAHEGETRIFSRTWHRSVPRDLV